MKTLWSATLRISLALILMLSSCFTGTTCTFADEVHPNDYEEITPHLTQALYDYLNDVYINRFPELATRMIYGTKKDKEVLTTLAQSITKDCKNDQEKVDAIAQWIKRNIKYVSPSSAYGIDTFYERKGNCYSQSELIVDLLRSLGIPSAVTLGYYANMKLIPPYGRIGGHVWLFAYIDGKWELYDTVYNRYGLTDVDEINGHFYNEIVDGITLNYDGFDLSKTMLGIDFLYKDGKFYAQTDEGNVPDMTSYAYGQNELWLAAVIKQDNDNRTYLENPERKDAMVNGQLYTDGWLQTKNGTYVYCYENGMLANNTVMKMGDKEYYTYYTNALDIQMSDDVYFLKKGYLNIKKGYEGSFVKFIETEKYENNTDYNIVYESSEPNVIEINQDGTIKCKENGTARISVNVYQTGSEEAIAGNSAEFVVTDETHEPDFTDKVPETIDDSIANPLDGKKVKISSVKSKKKKTLDVKWKKLDGAEGYLIKYGTDKKVSKKVKKKKTTKKSITLKKLSSKKKYYVKVCAYATVNNQTVYSKWSSVKKAKVK